MIHFASVYELILKFQGDSVDYMSNRLFFFSPEGNKRILALKIIQTLMKDKENYMKCNIDCTILFSRLRIVIL